MVLLRQLHHRVTTYGMGARTVETEKLACEIMKFGSKGGLGITADGIYKFRISEDLSQS